MRTVNRTNQKPEVIYTLTHQSVVFVSPDGEGRYYYDSVDEAVDQHGDLPVIKVERIVL